MGIILNLFIVVGKVNYVIVVGYTRILHGNFFYHCGPNLRCSGRSVCIMMTCAKSDGASSTMDYKACVSLIMGANEPKRTHWKICTHLDIVQEKIHVSGFRNMNIVVEISVYIGN